MQTKGTCLIIGANGFIGSHLVDELAEVGYKVRAFDRYSKPAQFSKSNNVEIFQGDFFDDMTVFRSLQNIDYVFHSFSATTPFSADSDPYTDVSLNLLRNIQLFEKSVEAGVKKIAYISSGGAVYGTIAERKNVAEGDAPEPVSPYGIGKLASEYYLSYFNRKYGLDYVAYRLSNPYGPRQVTKNNQGVIPSFIKKMSEHEDITVIGDGTSSRDYIYIRDATAMMAQSFKNAQQHIYNLGSGQQTSVNEVIRTLQPLVHTESIVKYADEPKTFLRHAKIDTTRFANEFKIESSTSLEAGLRLTLEAI